MIEIAPFVRYRSRNPFSAVLFSRSLSQDFIAADSFSLMSYLTPRPSDRFFRCPIQRALVAKTNGGGTHSRRSP